MLLNFTVKGADGQAEDVSPHLLAALEELRDLSVNGRWPLSARQRQLLDHAHDAAAETKAQLERQSTRIRYLQNLSITDELTGLLNRRGFEAELNRALARAERVGETGLLLLCDLNQFKMINDTFGHLAGDMVLRAVAGLLRQNVRRSDYLARLGGDEFALLMSHTAQGPATQAVCKLIRLLKDARIDWHGQLIQVSASFGYALYDANSVPQALMAQADLALYRDKAPEQADALQG